jgi:hypothetical protein
VRLIYCGRVNLSKCLLPDYLDLKNPFNHVTAYVLIEALDVRKFEQPNIDHFPCLFCVSKATGQSIWVS